MKVRFRSDWTEDQLRISLGRVNLSGEWLVAHRYDEWEVQSEWVGLQTGLGLQGIEVWNLKGPSENCTRQIPAICLEEVEE